MSFVRWNTLLCDIQYILWHGHSIISQTHSVRGIADVQTLLNSFCVLSFKRLFMYYLQCHSPMSYQVERYSLPAGSFCDDVFHNSCSTAIMNLSLWYAPEMRARALRRRKAEAWGYWVQFSWLFFGAFAKFLTFYIIMQQRNIEKIS